MSSAAPSPPKDKPVSSSSSPPPPPSTPKARSSLVESAMSPSAEETETERVLKKLYAEVESKVRKESAYATPPVQRMPTQKKVRKCIILALF